ncbi:MAG: sigma-54-dependent transcriptional regulator [Candidatus Eutrophobiaceae bacterium]
MNERKILIVDDEPDIRSLVQEILEDEGYTVCQAEDGRGARQAFLREQPQLVLLDVWMPDVDGITLLKEWKEGQKSDVPVVVMSGHGTVKTAVEATRLGAYDYIEKPLSTAKLLLTVRHALESGDMHRENLYLWQVSGGQRELIVGKSKPIVELRQTLERVAAHNAPAMILGEAGVGKEACAAYIHYSSTRCALPFQKTHIDSTNQSTNAQLLFGNADIPSAFESAEGGTLFIKDIALLDLELQQRLHQIVSSGRFTRTDHEMRHDVRIIAASRHDLPTLARQGKFLAELFYQLSVLPVHVPTLCERREDLPELLEHYANFLAEKEDLPFRRFSVASQNRLREYPWVGNLRELKNMVRRLLILGSSETVEVDEVDEVLREQPPASNSDEAMGVDLKLDQPLRTARREFECAYLRFHLKKHQGNISQTAGAIGVERTHLYRKLKDLDISTK